MYLTYQQYKTQGGKLDATEFAQAYKPARYRFDRWTHGRLTQYEADGGGPDFIAYDMTLLIDNIKDIYGGDVLTSYSNGVETYGLSASASRSAESKIYAMFCDATPLQYRSANIYESRWCCHGACRF